MNGCPSPDRDGDAFDDAADRCPDEAETHDGTTDDDGCPEPESVPPRPPLARFVTANQRTLLELSQAIAFETDQNGTRVADASLGVVRAIAALLNQHPGYVLLVATKPASADAAAEQAALTQAFALVSALQRITHRDEVAETIGWAAVRSVPKATRGTVGFLVRVTPPPATATAPPEKGPLMKKSQP